ncbi:MAG: hypothetical protein ACUVUG_10325 [Candidatus Aminicenantia bacterium]
MERELKILSISFWAGSIWDWLASFIIIFFPGTVTLFKVPYPQELMYFRFAGLLLFILPFFYIYAALRPQREEGIIKSAIIARFTGFLFLFTHYIFFNVKFLFLFFGIIDLFFGLWHLYFYMAYKIKILGRQK